MNHSDDLSNLEAQLHVERTKVDVSSHNFSVRELVRMLDEGELNIAPEYQRKYRWSKEVASTLIESLFLGLPIPPIFVATNANFELEVVDGLQRLSTMLYFVGEGAEALAKVNRTEPLELVGLQKLSQLNGYSYSDLPLGLQRYFGRQPIQVISLTDKSSKEVRFDLFERLNAGAIALSPQEVRACIYRGPFNDFIERLSNDENFQTLLKLQKLRQHDGTAAEIVLKFFAYKNNGDQFDGRVTKFLNNYSELVATNFDYVREERLFRDACAFLAGVTGGPLIRSNTKITPLVQLEGCLVGIGRLLQAGTPLVAPPAGWVEDAELVDASIGGSNTQAKLSRRVSRAEEIFSGR